MRKVLQSISLILLAFLVFQNCSNTNSESNNSANADKEQLADEIKQLEETLKAKSALQIDQTLAKDLINKNVFYAETYPEDELSPAYLFRAGNVAIGIGSFKEAVGFFEIVHQKYLNYDRAPDALFLEGFTYENHLNDLENAKKCYNDFLKRFPENQLAEQVRVVLDNIDKSPEELVKSFQKK